MPATYRVTAPALNLRADPEPAAAVRAVLNQGDLLSGTALAPATLPDGNIWVNVRTATGEATGWINRKFTEELSSYRVIAASLNLRAAPRPDAEVRAILAQGEVVAATGVAPTTLPDGNIWVNVRTAAAATGWINRKFAEERAHGDAPTDAGADGGALAWGTKVSADFRARVRQICADLGCEPDHLMAAMAFETGETFSPSIRNRTSGATGLIQFLPSTAKNLGTTTAELAQMTAERQLDFVESYFKPQRGRLQGLEDVYMAILFPVAVGKASGFVLFARPSDEYTQNSGLDRDGDGAVTKAEAASAVAAKLAKGRRQEFAR